MLTPTPPRPPSPAPMSRFLLRRWDKNDKHKAQKLDEVIFYFDLIIAYVNSYAALSKLRSMFPICCMSDMKSYIVFTCDRSPLPFSSYQLSKTAINTNVPSTPTRSMLIFLRPMQSCAYLLLWVICQRFQKKVGGNIKSLSLC